MVQVKAKNKHAEGFVLGVEFTKGVAETDNPAALAFFRGSDDYNVVDVEPVEAPAEDDKPAEAKPAADESKAKAASTKSDR